MSGYRKDDEHEAYLDGVRDRLAPQVRLGHVVCEFAEWQVTDEEGGDPVWVECIGQMFEEIAHRTYVEEVPFVVTMSGDGTMVPAKTTYEGTGAINLMLEWFKADEIVALLTEWKSANNIL